MIFLGPQRGRHVADREVIDDGVGKRLFLIGHCRRNFPT